MLVIDFIIKIQVACTNVLINIRKKMYRGSVKNLKSIFESEFLKLQMENVKAQNDKIVTI